MNGRVFLLCMLAAAGTAHAADRPAHPATHRAGHGATHEPAASPRHGKPAKAAKPAAHPTPPPAAVPATAPPAAPKLPPPDPNKGTSTGLPLPRFASLKTDEVNMRTGPGVRYPIEWVYKRRDLPVEIEREFEVWRQVTDEDGVKGWVHQATLAGRRSFVTMPGEHVLRSDAHDTAAAVAVLKPGVIGRLRACAAEADWCEVQVGDYRGWLKRTDFWGTLPGEAIQP